MAKSSDDIKNRLSIALSLRNMKPIELSEKTKIPKSSISQYMSGYSKPNSERTLLICQALNISEAWLLGFDVPMERYSAYTEKYSSPNITEEYTTFPIIGDIAAGYDHIAIENWYGDTIDIPNTYLKGRDNTEFLVLCVKGDSMYPAYQEGDKVLILRQTTIEYSGQVGAIIYDGEYATLKKIEYKSNEKWIKLVPINPSYPTITIENGEDENYHIIGIPKLVIREIND